MTCPRCNYPEIYTEGEHPTFEVWCGHCIYNFNSTERKKYFKYLKNNGLHIVRPENYWLHPGNFIKVEGSDPVEYMPENEIKLMRIENKAARQSRAYANWKEKNPEKYAKHVENVKKFAEENPEIVLERHRKYNKDNREQINEKKKKYNRWSNWTI